MTITLDSIKTAPPRENTSLPARSKSADLAVPDPQPGFHGAMLLDLIHKILEYYARWAEPEWVDVTTLWIAHTWFAAPGGMLAFDTTPRWMAVAPPHHGKGRMGRLINAMSRNPTGLVTSDVTAPGVRNALHAGMTVILDEFQRTVGTGRAKQAVQSIVTGGYNREGVSLNGIGGVTERSAFGPVALLAQPRIITGTQDLLEDIFDRAFTITPEPLAKGDTVPDLDSDFRRRTEAAVRGMKTWATLVTTQCAGTDGLLWAFNDDLPFTLEGRNREISLPLLTVADYAVNPELVKDGGRDLRWAVRAREACTKMLTGSGETGVVMEEIRVMYAEMVKLLAA